jgi:hypothetical protein
MGVEITRLMRSWKFPESSRDCLSEPAASWDVA